MSFIMRITITASCVMVILGLYSYGALCTKSSLQALTVAPQLSAPTNTQPQQIPTAFDKAIEKAFDPLLQVPRTRLRRNIFDPQTHEGGTGGLSPHNRVVLAEIYGKANSVFEFGLGESTTIASLVDVPIYAGVDSDPVWVANARDSVLSRSPQFRFYLADIGKTKEWGYPVDPLIKNVWDYQIAPLAAEPHAFDVYMIDGRWRFPCLIAAFLHASARRRRQSAAVGNDVHTTVLVHDCFRKIYHSADHVLQLNMTGNDVSNILPEQVQKLCIFRRKPETTDEELLDIWVRYHQETE